MAFRREGKGEMEKETVLSEEKRVTRAGDAVWRPATASTPHIHAFLRHLGRQGLPVPRVLAEDVDGRAALSFLEGEQVHPGRWSGGGLAAVARLTRALHDAAQGHAPEADAAWPSWCLREIGGPERILCHGDIAPWNVITKDGLPVGLIDWEFVGPLDPLVELARVCWLFPQLHDDDLAALHGLPPVAERAAQVRGMADAYGLSDAGRQKLLDTVLSVVICETAHEAIDPGLTPGAQGSLWGFAWRTRSLYWIWRNRDALRRALV